jgi:hypothetical protein
MLDLQNSAVAEWPREQQKGSVAHAGVAQKDGMRLTMVERRVRSEKILIKDGV